MAELLVFTKVLLANPNPAINNMRFQLGHVITIQEDGHQWGTGDLNGGHAKVVKVPGVAVRDLEFLVTPQFAPFTGARTSIPLQLRMWKIANVNLIPAVVADTTTLQTHLQAIPPVAAP